MDEIQAMSDAQLRAELVKQGANVGPVTGTTRGVFEKKLFKLRQSAPAAPLTPKTKKTITPPVVVPKGAASSSVRRSTRKNINRSESEEGSDDEIEIISPKQNSTPTARKPVSSTPTRERTPSPPAPKRSVRRPANSIIPGLNTTLNSSLNSVKSTTVTTSKLFITPGGDQPGSTPPRKILRTPPRSVTHASGTSTSSFLSPDATLNISPKFSVHTSSVTRRNLATLGHTTEEDDSDAGEETSRVVHNIVSSGKDRRSGVRRALDGFLGNDLSAGDHPGSNYELRRGTIRTNVVRDSKTGRLSVKQRSVWSDIPRMLLLILICFFVVLGIAYVIASRPENFASTIFLVKTTVRDTCEFFYKYAVLPVAIVTGACVAITGLYFAHKWYREKQAKEQEAFEDLVEKIIDMVQDETENGEENITVPHVRDKMYPPAKRSAGHMALWERAVQFINENESRIATECALIRGQECQVWRWIPYKKSGWQGSAFHTPIAKKSTENGTEKSTDKYLSSNIPAVALTRCLKVRDIHENRDGKHPLEPINFDALKYQILEKVYPIRPVHLQFDPLNQDSVLYMKLNNKEDAKAAFDSLHAKWFNGHLITVKYVRDSRYNDRFPITSNV